MNQIEIGYDKRFLREKRKFNRKCSSIDLDFKRFEKALIVDLEDNNYKIPLDTKKYSKISGFLIKSGPIKCVPITFL